MRNFVLCLSTLVYVHCPIQQVVVCTKFVCKPPACRKSKEGEETHVYVCSSSSAEHINGVDFITVSGFLLLCLHLQCAAVFVLV